jgi:hypothetical protein
MTSGGLCSLEIRQRRLISRVMCKPSDAAVS